MLDDPALDFVAEFGQLDVVDFVLLLLAENVDLVAGQSAGEFDVRSAFANGERDLIAVQVDARAAFLGVEVHVVHPRGRQCALDEQVLVIGEVDDVDVLVVEFAHDAVNPRSLHPDAGTDRVDAVVVAFHSDLGAFARQAHDALNADESVLDFGYFLFHQFCQERIVRPADDDRRVVVPHFHLFNDGADHFTLAEEVAPNHFVARQQQFFAGVVVDDQNFALQNLVHFAQNDGADQFGVPLVLFVLRQFHQARNERLTRRHDGAPPEVDEVQLFVALFADFVVFVDAEGFADADLFQFVGHLAVGNDGADAPEFQVALLGVHDDVEVLVRTVFFPNQGAENVLEDAHHRRTVHILDVLEFGKGFY